MIGVVPPELQDKSDLEFNDLAPFIATLMSQDFRINKVEWFSRYQIHHRRAAQFEAGRCLLLGDAAHLHSPAGAQGMNTGLQGAYNLGWKLALVCKDAADDGLLSTYAEERVPVAVCLLQTTDRRSRASPPGRCCCGCCGAVWQRWCSAASCAVTAHAGFSFVRSRRPPSITAAVRSHAPTVNRRVRCCNRAIVCRGCTWCR